MTLKTLFEQLKNIEPDRGYTLRSRNEILSSPQRAVRPWAMRTFVFGMLQSGAAMALVALILLVLGGGISAKKFVVKTAGLDQKALTAEAQAIDIQIQLADVSYQNFSSAGNQTLKPATKPHPLPPAAATATSSATSTPDMSVDQALELLSH